MNGFFDWIVAVWEDFKFFKICESWEGGIRFRAGVPETTPLGAGIWFYWPIKDRIEIIPTKARYIDLPTQTATTADGEAVSFSANICYEIENAVLAYTEVHDLEDSVSRASMGHLHGRIHGWTLAELMAGLKDLEKSLEGTLTTRTKRWGVRVLDVKLTDMVRSKVFRLFQI